MKKKQQRDGRVSSVSPENFMQRQLRDDKVNRINWERKDERDTESTHMQTDDDATTEGVVCVCIYTYVYIYMHTS